MVLPWLCEFGWEATVLAVKPEYVQGVHDECLAKTLPPDLRVVWTNALSTRWTRCLGVRSLAYRAGRYLRHAGSELLRCEPFDALFFSTTVFPTMAFGPEWKRQFRVPYVLDFQDPWLSDYYEEHPQQRPPGGRLKYAFARWRAKCLEPRQSAKPHIVCVSPAYPPMFQRRYLTCPTNGLPPCPLLRLSRTSTFSVPARSARRRLTRRTANSTGFM